MECMKSKMDIAFILFIYCSVCVTFGTVPQRCCAVKLLGNNLRSLKIVNSNQMVMHFTNQNISNSTEKPLNMNLYKNTERKNIPLSVRMKEQIKQPLTMSQDSFKQILVGKKSKKHSLFQQVYPFRNLSKFVPNRNDSMKISVHPGKRMKREFKNFKHQYLRSQNFDETPKLTVGEPGFNFDNGYNFLEHSEEIYRYQRLNPFEGTDFFPNQNVREYFQTSENSIGGKNMVHNSRMNKNFMSSEKKRRHLNFNKTLNLNLQNDSNDQNHFMTFTSINDSNLNIKQYANGMIMKDKRDYPTTMSSMNLTELEVSEFPNPSIDLRKNTYQKQNPEFSNHFLNKSLLRETKPYNSKSGGKSSTSALLEDIRFHDNGNEKQENPSDDEFVETSSEIVLNDSSYFFVNGTRYLEDVSKTSNLNLSEIFQLMRHNRTVRSRVLYQLFLYLPVLYCDILIWIMCFKLLSYIYQKISSTNSVEMIKTIDLMNEEEKKQLLEHGQNPNDEMYGKLTSVIDSEMKERHTAKSTNK